MHRPLVIMHIEDNDDHAELLSSAAYETRIVDKVIRFRSADSCSEYLFGILPAAGEGSVALPDLILLDLGLPGMSGIEFLRLLRANPVTRPIPVIILTVTGAEDRIAAAYQAGANSYIVKPATYEDFVITLAELNAYWSVTSALPRTVISTGILT